MFVGNTPHGEKLFIYKEGITKEETRRAIKNKVIDNKQYLIVGSSGSGKSVLCNTMVFEYWKHGYTVVYVTEKTGNEYDNAFCVFPPDKTYQKNLLDRQQEKSYDITHTKGLAKFYHPFSFEIPSKESTIPTTYFTFSLKNLNENALASILQGDVDKNAVRVCMREINKLDSKDSFYKLIQKLAVNEKLMGDSGDSSNEKIDIEENFGVPTITPTRKDSLQAIFEAFQPFRNHYCVREESASLNLDYVKMLNDQESMHFLSTRFIKNKRVKYFVYIMFIQEVMSALDSGKIKNPVLLVFEEIKVLLPRTSDISYQEQLSKLFRELLATARTKGRGVTSIATTQSLNSTNKEYVDSVDPSGMFMGRLSQVDLAFLKRTNPVLARSMESTLLDELKTGQFIWLQDVLRGKIRKLCTNVPPFKIAEESDQFETLFKKNFPEMMISNKEIMKREKDSFDKMEKEHKEAMTNVRKEIKKVLEKKERVKSAPAEDPLKNAPKEGIIELKQEFWDNERNRLLTMEGYRTTLDIGKVGYNIRSKYIVNGKQVSWFMLGELFGKHFLTIRKRVLKYGKEIEQPKDTPKEKKEEKNYGVFEVKE